MNVAFGLTVFQRGRARNCADGIANYSHALLQHLGHIPDVHLTPFTFAVHAPVAGEGELLDLGRFVPQAVFSHFTGLPFPRLTAHCLRGIDLIHATDHWIPVTSRVPVLATLMDAIPLAHPEWATARLRGLKNRLWRQAARKARHVLTISEYSRNEIIRWFGIPESRISVASLGVDARWFVPPTTDARARLVDIYALPERYFLFLGTLQPRKNLATLIRAHRMLSPSLRREFPLVVAGRPGWACAEEVAALEAGDEGALRWLKFVPDADIVALVHGASAMLLPSRHEGFGLPVLEAFAASTPVICANGSALPEVAGDAALLVDPEDAAGMAEAMAHLVQDDTLVAQLRERGLARAKYFSWERTAELTAACYRQLSG